MHLRLSVWLALFAFVASPLLRAQTPAAPASDALPSAPGQITAAKVTGDVTATLNGTSRALHSGDSVAQSETVNTALNSSVVLVFSNGATTQLGPDTTLVVEQFLQDPFSDAVQVATMTA